MLQITGIFTPYTFEANINIAAPDYNIPATMCHELAHSRGFMREDEANFIGYLACRESDSAEFQYSGTMLALVHSINRLYDADYDAFLEVNALMSEGVRLDFADNNAYWARYEGPVAEVSTAVIPICGLTTSRTGCRAMAGWSTSCLQTTARGRTPRRPIPSRFKTDSIWGVLFGRPVCCFLYMKGIKKQVRGTGPEARKKGPPGRTANSG